MSQIVNILTARDEGFEAAKRYVPPSKCDIAYHDVQQAATLGTRFTDNELKEFLDHRDLSPEDQTAWPTPLDARDAERHGSIVGMATFLKLGRYRMGNGYKILRVRMK